ncbi:hypothetical protein CB0940_08949 [Cercospora beticola]|uniref:Uncharacterized protein n=1 Tax=Cercospora beticola TaxID=122368 RepID=A0A2G5HPQ0_CERBT|nr:hypothetical protein CB0940_08949 [Cercospora beticola]PIA94524.1 hypothetical protein CB0940_08949 [Cercospora beticola]WPB05546.1 hypothetical protein RHO25_010199 [Cercospora beticola]
MPTSLKEIRASNASLHQTHSSPTTALFVGATSGIGLATLQAFAKHIPFPHTIIIRRNQKTFQPHLDNLKTLNPNRTYTFLESDISLLANVDSVSQEIKSILSQQPNSKLDLLFLSQGYISFTGREENADGLDNSVSLRYYSRIRFIQTLLPVMSSSARAVSILAGGKEGKIFEDDLDLKKNYSVGNAAGQFATMMTLSFDNFSSQSENSGTGFCACFSGVDEHGSTWEECEGCAGSFDEMGRGAAVGCFGDGEGRGRGGEDVVLCDE